MPAPRQAVRWPAAVLGLLLCCDPALPRKGHGEGLTAAAPGPSKSPAAGERRRAERLARTARARELEGKVREALDAYLALAALDAGGVLLPLPGEPAVKASPAVLARAGVAGMLARADDRKKKVIAAEVRRRWEALKGREEVGALRAFVAAFGPETPEGRAARLRLADLLAREASFRAAELLLEEVRRHPGEARSAGRAVLGLAKVCAREGLLADAVHYYDVLARDFGKVVLPGGRTGSDLRDELATDKRFLPYLDSKPDFPGGKFRVVAREERGPYPAPPEVYSLNHVGEPLPFFRRYDLAVRFGADETDVVDRTTAGWLKRASVSGTAFRRVVGDPGVGGRAKFSYQSLSHLVVLPLGDGVLGIDPVGRRTLWQRDLSGAGKEGAPEPKAVSFRPRDGAVQVSYAGGWSGRLGVALPLGPAGVCVAGREGLLCLDPLTGRTRWLRSDVKPGAHVFGDAQTVFAVETAAGGSASSTRAFRVADGRSVKVPDFRKEYDRRVRVLDGRLVVSEKGAKGEVILSLYDPRTGRSPWRQRYRARSIVLSAVDTGLAGVVAPDGTVHVTDPRTGKRVLGAKVDPGHLKGAREVYLLADRKQIYLAVNRAPDKGVTPEGGGVESLFGRGTGLRWLPVNGEVYSFDRATGALRWRDERTWQTLALERFEDLPVLLFTARRGRNQLASPPSPFTGIEGACGAVSGFVDRLKISPRWYHGIHGDCGPVSDFRYGMLDVAPKREKIKPPRTREKRKPPREREQVRPPVLQAFDKRTGKLVYDDQAVPDDMRFYALEVRPAEGAVHLIGKGLEVRFELVPRP